MRAIKQTTPGINLSMLVSLLRFFNLDTIDIEKQYFFLVQIL